MERDPHLGNQESQLASRRPSGCCCSTSGVNWGDMSRGRKWPKWLDATEKSGWEKNKWIQREDPWHLLITIRFQFTGGQPLSKLCRAVCITIWQSSCARYKWQHLLLNKRYIMMPSSVVSRLWIFHKWIFVKISQTSLPIIQSFHVILCDHREWKN